MQTINQLLNLCDAFAASRKLSRSRVSTLVFNDGKVIDRLANGGDITVRRLSTAIIWFSSHWPEDLDWPSDISQSQSTIIGKRGGELS